MTNTYQALCDDVGIKPEKPCLSGKRTCTMPCLDKQRVCQYLAYPPQSAEQRERLEELILVSLEKYFDFIGDWKIVLSPLQKWRFKDGTYCYTIDKITHYNESQGDDDIFIEVRSKSSSDALYALTRKLVAEGVLSKEEVAKALKEGK